VQKWLAAAGDRPTDEFVERIPIRETRHYVKRVLGTFEMYRTLYDDGAIFPDWSAYMPRAQPREG
jgi:soluble lytic murein transglycosylase